MKFLIFLSALMMFGCRDVTQTQKAAKSYGQEHCTEFVVDCFRGGDTGAQCLMLCLTGSTISARTLRCYDELGGKVGVICTSVRQVSSPLRAKDYCEGCSQNNE